MKQEFDRLAAVAVHFLEQRTECLKILPRLQLTLEPPFVALSDDNLGDRLLAVEERPKKLGIAHPEAGVYERHAR